MKKYLKDFFVILFLTCVFGFGANRIMEVWLFRIAFPESIALEDFHWEDFAFKLRPDVKKENKIILINIGSGGRREIAQQIERISKFQPKVIGVDVFFNCDNGTRDSINCPQLLDTLGNIMLSDAFDQAGNVVLISKLLQKKTTMQAGLVDHYDSLEYSDEIFNRFAHHGFANVMTNADNELDVKECRSIISQMEVNEKKEYCFAVQVAMLFDSAKAHKFLDRKHEEEWINYRGNVSPYHYDLGSKTVTHTPYFDAVESDSLMKEKFPGNIIKDKIVLVGYLGDYLNDPAYENKFYTPLNPTFAGRSLPDMLGLTLHANVVSMILNEDYIDQLSNFWELTILLIVIVFNVLMFIYLHKRSSVWYDSLCFILPVFQIIIFAWLRMELLANFNFRLDLEGVIYLIAFVSFATNLYYGPILNFFSQLEKRNAHASPDTIQS